MNNKIIIKNDKNEEKTYDILFTFDKNNKKYITYTEYKKDENGNIITYSSYYDINDDTKKLNEVETKEELNIINKMIETIEYNIKND